MLNKKYHRAIYAIYGFVRLADEIVDTFHDYDKRTLLEKFSRETHEAIQNGISTNPVLHSFQKTVRQYNIENSLIDSFLLSMRMDLTAHEHNQSSYEEYIYGSAEAVGLMCLRVFCEGDEIKYNSLFTQAKKLGAAFQKVNFLRDLNSDFSDRGRIYFPGVDFNSFNNEDKQRIEQDIKRDFTEAYDGIINLPRGATLGVMTAYTYYRSLFEKITLMPANKIRKERIRIPNVYKLQLLITAWFKYHLRLL